jgi:hypothetical protein
MNPVSTGLLPDGDWNLDDIDHIAVHQGSLLGPIETHLALVGAPAPAGGTWTSFISLSDTDIGVASGTIIPGRPLRFSKISLARVDAQVHLCGITKQFAERTFSTRESGILAHVVRTYRAPEEPGTEFPERSQWGVFENVSTLSGNVGNFVDVGCAGVINPATGFEELQVCAVTEDGRLWHTLRNSPTNWTPYSDVQAQAGNVGPLRAIDCAADGNLLHVVAVSRNGRAYYTIRNAAGTWRPFEDVQNAATAPLVEVGDGKIYDVGIGLYNDGLPAGQWQLIIVATPDPKVPLPRVPGDTFYTVRSSQPVVWQPAAVRPSLWKPWTWLDGEAYSDGGKLFATSVAWRPRLT